MKLSRALLSLAGGTAIALSLAACKERGGEETRVGVNVETGDGSVTASSANGTATIDTPGGRAVVNTGGVKLDSADFDIDGVQLFPGSNIRSMNVNAVDKPGVKNAAVTVGFDSPADAKTVADYFQKEMTAKKFTTARTGYDISGQTPDGSSFTLKIADLGGGKSNGTLSITDKK